MSETSWTMFAVLNKTKWGVDKELIGNDMQHELQNQIQTGDISNLYGSPSYKTYLLQNK